MFGHALPLGAADFCDGALVDGVVADVLGVAAAAAVEVVDAADALVIPAAAPPVASAPAIMVAPSILEMVMVGRPPGSVGCGAVIVREVAKHRRSWA
jgi:hypothetical protein